MKRNSRVVAGAVGAIVLAAFCLGFLPEIQGLAWHVKNGRTARLGQYEIPVPLWAYATAEPEQNSVTVFLRAGEWRQVVRRNHNQARITFSVAPLGFTATEKRLFFGADLFTGRGFSVSAERIAGEDKSCWKHLSQGATVNLVCRSDGGGLEVRFVGDEALVSEYESNGSRIKKTQQHFGTESFGR